ncbi:hypothetical protein ACFYY1_35575 [Streptomyces sp. NPDC001890]|uniref:hypothetical protein n=1 Tax=Streptomyces sp. NPDC001890 TaxID=3364620 RepID=UPI0036AD424C
MPDTDLLYALPSTYNHPWLSDVAGPDLLINDPVVAMRWYLTHEREEELLVTMRISADGGAVWQELRPDELLAQAERALMERAQAPEHDGQRTAALLADALAAEAADWLDHRIRYVQPDDPTLYRPETPAMSSWRRGGQIWALALGTVPNEQVLTHLAAQYTDPQPEGPEQLQTGARDTLDALALADDPTHAGIPRLLGTLGYLNQLTFGIELGQLRDRAEHAQRNIMDHLITHHPQTSAVAKDHPDPKHPAQQAARAYLHRLSRITPSGEERLLDDAAHDFAEALAAAEAVQQPTTAGPDTDNTKPEAIPGYPKFLAGDLQAAAQWRRVSPAAQRAADRAMTGLVHASTALAEAYADPEQPASPREDQAVRLQTDLTRELNELNAQHALLMHASVMAEAEDAGVRARHDAIDSAAHITEAILSRPHTTDEIQAGQKKFMAHVNEAENGIAQTLGAQRQLTRDALHRLFPHINTSRGLHQLRSQLIDHSGLGFGAYNEAWQAIGETGQTLEDLEARYRSGIVEPGSPPVTAEDVVRARTSMQEANDYFTGLRRSRPLTLRAVQVLDGVAGLEPSSPDSIAGRLNQITALSRQRAQQSETEAPIAAPVVNQHHQAQSLQGPQAAGTRLP